MILTITLLTLTVITVAGERLSSWILLPLLRGLSICHLIQQRSKLLLNYRLPHIANTIRVTDLVNCTMAFHNFATGPLTHHQIALLRTTAQDYRPSTPMTDIPNLHKLRVLQYRFQPPSRLLAQVLLKAVTFSQQLTGALIHTGLRRGFRNQRKPIPLHHLGDRGTCRSLTLS